MDEVYQLQQKLESEHKPLEFILTLELYEEWLNRKTGNNKIAIAKQILKDDNLFRKVHLELEYGVFDKDSETGGELYLTVVGGYLMKSRELNATIKRMQESYTIFKQKNWEEQKASYNSDNS